MVVKDEHDRILMTHEAASENGDDARQFLQRLKDCGLKVTAAFSDDSQSFTEAIKSVYPHARFQADHFHTVKNVWGHLKKSLLSYRRQVKASGEAQQDEACMALTKKLWTLRWSLLKKLALYLQRRSKLLQSWKARMKDLCPASAMLSGNWCIFLTIRTAKRKPSSDYNN